MPVPLLTHTCDLWTAADNVEADGNVLSSTKSRAHRDVRCNLQPMPGNRATSLALDVRRKYRMGFFPDTLTTFPTDTIVVDTVNLEYWKVLEGTQPERWAGMFGVGGHWRVDLQELHEPPTEVEEAYD